jgi:hypothetical protein
MSNLDINSGVPQTAVHIPLPSELAAQSATGNKSVSKAADVLITDHSTEPSVSPAVASSAVQLIAPLKSDLSTSASSLQSVKGDLQKNGLPSPTLLGTLETGNPQSAQGAEMNDLMGGGTSNGAISFGTLIAEIALLAEQQNETEEAQFSAIDSGELSQLSTDQSALDEGIQSAEEGYKAALAQGISDIVGGVLGAGMGFVSEGASMATTGLAKGIGQVAAAGYQEDSQIDAAQAQFLNSLSGSEGQEIQSMVSGEQNTQSVFSSLEQAIQSIAQLESQSASVTRPAA